MLSNISSSNSQLKQVVPRKEVQIVMQSKSILVSQSASISTAESRVIKHSIRQQKDKTKSSQISQRNEFSKAPFQPYPLIIHPLGRAFPVQQLMDRMNNPGLDDRHQEVTEEVREITNSLYKKKLKEKKTEGIFHPVSLRSHSNENIGLSQQKRVINPKKGFGSSSKENETKLNLVENIKSSFH